MDNAILRQIAGQIPRLRSHARLLLGGDTVLADELVKNCVEQAVARRDTLPDHVDLRYWLLALLHRPLADFLRDSGEGNRWLDASVPAIAAGDDLATAVSRLADTERSVFLLAVIEELNLAQVAAVLDLDIATVDAAFRRAWQALRVGAFAADDADPATWDERFADVRVAFGA